MRKLKTLAAWCVITGLALLIPSVHAEILISDNFSYEGALTNNGWIAYSGADGSITANGLVAQIGSGAEDIRLAFADQGTGPTYASFTINVQTLPASGGEYSWGFSDSTAMDSRFGIVSESSGSAYGVTIYGADTTVLGTFSGLALNTDYQIAVYFDGVDNHRLWVDPESGDFAAPDLTATGANSGIDGFFIRQAGALDIGAAAWTMGALVVATTFDDVVSGGGSPTTNVRFTASAAAVGEDAGTYEVTVIKTLPEGNFSGEIALSGTATEGVDYTIDTTNFVMNGATTSATFTITIIDDLDEEADETVILTLANVTGGDVGTPSVFTLTIEDNDTPPPPAGTVVVDFEGVGETKGSYGSGTVNLSGLDWDMTEALIGTDANDFKNGARSARMRGYAASSMTLLEDLTDGLGSISFQYRRYGTDTQVDWMVEYTTDGSTWNQVGTEFTAPASDDVQTFEEDVNVSGNVRVRIKRFTETGAANARLNIDDISLAPFGTSEPTTNVRFAVASASVGEGDGTYDVVIVKTLPEGDVSGEIQLGGTAMEGDDYFISATNFTMNGAVTSATITVTIVDDGDVEADPTVILTLANITGGSVGSPSVFTLTILDNDIPPPPAGAIAYYTFSGNSAAAEYADANVSASDVAMSSGSFSYGTSQSTEWTGSGIPYADAVGGWTNETDQTLAKHFLVGVDAASGYVMTITNISLLYRTTAAGPPDVGLTLNDSILYGESTVENITTSLSFAVTGYANITSAVLKIQGWDGGSRISTGGGSFRVDDILVQGVVALDGGGPVLPVDPEVGPITLVGGQADVTVETEAGLYYYLVYPVVPLVDITIDPLDFDQWDVADSVEPASGGPVVLSDPDAGTASDRVYGILISTVPLL